MHHVKNDKRSQTSANAIYEALLKLLKSNSFDTITVSSICEESNISRATFYRNFDILEDVLAWYGDLLIRKLIANYFKLPNNARPAFTNYALGLAFDEVEYIEVLSKTNKMHLIEPYVLTVLKSVPLTYDINESPYIKYAIHAKVAAFFSIINCWIVSGKKESIEELQNNLYEIYKYIHTIDVQS
ncbi:MAG: TetR/AcrR family transcriptional regulator [Erysipelotrichaceae bacterium]|nr:TetR/AcrR family transcriptional regulator [Erysipelotrichaceae bacterium]